MKKILFLLLLLPAFTFSQDIVKRTTIVQLKAYNGSAPFIYVADSNAIYATCSPCTADEYRIFDGTRGQKWKEIGRVTSSGGGGSDFDTTYMKARIDSLVDALPGYVTSASLMALLDVKADTNWVKSHGYASKDSTNAFTADQIFENTTAATNGVQQPSPWFGLKGQGWKTAATAGSQPVEWKIRTSPIQGTTAPNGDLDFIPYYNSTIGGGYFSLVGSNITNAFAGLSFRNNAGTERGFFQINIQTGQIKIGANSGGYYPAFYAEGQEFMRAVSATRNLLIGTTTDVLSSLVTISSTTKGFLLPRMTNTQWSAISSKATGLIAYQTDNDKFVYQGSSKVDTIATVSDLTQYAPVSHTHNASDITSGSFAQSRVTNLADSLLKKADTVWTNDKLQAAIAALTAEINTRSKRVLFSTTKKSHTGSTSETEIYRDTIKVSQNPMGLNSSLHFIYTQAATGTAGNRTLTLKINGTSVATFQFASGNSARTTRNYYTISNRNSLSSQVQGGAQQNGTPNLGFNGTSTNYIGTQSFNTANDLIITFTATLSNSADEVALEMFDCIMYP